MIMGALGSGKSTLARWLGAQTDFPVFHMDHIHHLAGWQPRPLPEKIAMAQAVVAEFSHLAVYHLTNRHTVDDF